MAILTLDVAFQVAVFFLVISIEQDTTAVKAMFRMIAFLFVMISSKIYLL